MPKRKSTRKRTIIRTGLPSPTWRLLNMGVPIVQTTSILADELERLLLVLPMVQAHRDTIVKSVEFIRKNTKKPKRSKRR
jgi:hypothetical protein